MKRLLVGDNPFIGVSHVSQNRAREKLERLDIEKIVGVIDTSLSFGATGFTFSTHPTNSRVLEELNGKVPRDFDLFPILPYAEGYVRLSNEIGTLGLIRHVFSKLSLTNKAKAILKGTVAVLKMDLVEMMGSYVDMELQGYLSIKPRNAHLRSVLMHDVLTDLALSFGARNLFESFIKHIQTRYRVKPGFVTRNFARLVDFFQESQIDLRNGVIMTPFNKIGFQMNPSREACEASLSRVHGCEVIAMSILAGGYLDLDGALEYLKALPNLAGVAVGVSSMEHAENTFRKLRTL